MKKIIARLNNMEKNKKLLAILLCFIFLISLFPQRVKAGINALEMKNGEITMNFVDKKASSGITYHTVGFIVHKNYAGSMDAAYSDSPVGKLIDSKFEEYKSVDLPGGQVQSFFRMSKEDVSLALYNAGMETWKEGQNIYLDSVFEVLKDGKKIGGYYYTYNEIANAAAWSPQTKEDLKDYFNIQLRNDPPPYPVYKQIIINGKEEPPQRITEIKPGENAKITFEKSVLKNGITAEIQKSYFIPMLDKKKTFEVDKSNPAVTDRNLVQVSGGVTVVAEYTSKAQVTVRYLDIKTLKDISTPKTYEINAGTMVKESVVKVEGYSYDYSIASVDGGKNWINRSTATTRNDKTGAETYIYFYYNSLGTVPPPDIKPPDGGNTPDPTPTPTPDPGGNTELQAKLNLSCDPQVIEKGKTATVEFILDASASNVPAGVDYYNFYFNDTGKFDSTKPDFKLEKSPVVTINKTKVKPNTTWYAKVQIIDKKGNPSYASAQIDIGEIEPEPKAEAHAKLQVNVVQNDEKILEWDDSLGFAGFYKLKILVPSEWDRKEKMYFDFVLDGSQSTSTNGIGSYRIMRMGDSEDDTMAGPASVKTIHQVIGVSPQEYLESGQDWIGDGYITFSLEVEDSVDSTATDRALGDIYFKYVFEKGFPKVALKINKNEFAKGENAVFTPTFTENEETYPITSKRWQITDSTGAVIESGSGVIPNTYPIYLGEGEYKATQFITFENNKLENLEDEADVYFKVFAIRPPDVTIQPDKTVYIIPTTGIFDVSFFEDSNYTYNISRKEYVFKNENGTIVAQNEGTFPNKLPFDIEMDGGFYIAQQTIYWWQDGVEKSKTAECKIKLISPRPSAAFKVSMKMSTNDTDWKRIDVEGEKGKVNKQIRIDLTPSIALNETLENPYPILFSSPNTQIQIIGTDKDTIGTVYTYNSSDLLKKDGSGTVSGKQYIDVRFDKAGTYTIKCRVANEFYIGNWVQRDIEIRQDLPPIVTMQLSNVTPYNDINRIFRNSNDLSAQFGVITTAIPQDEDTINTDSAILSIEYDYNADNDVSNDGVHSTMKVTKDKNELQPYINVSKNSSVNLFTVTMASNTFPVLGKIKMEYSVAEKPKIPNYVGGELPSIPELRGTTELLPLQNKMVLIDNQPGTITLDLGKESKIEIAVVLGTNSPHFNVQELKNYYGDTAKVYIVDKNGKTQAIN